MTAVSSVSGASELETNEAGTTKKITITQILTYIGATITSFAKAITINSNAANTAAILTLENSAGDFSMFRTDATPEAAVTGSPGDMCVDSTSGHIYIKVTGAATNTGWRRMNPDVPVSRSSSITTSSTGIVYASGHYDFSTTDANLTQASQTVNHGVANEPHASHVAIIAGGAGTATGGAGAVEIEVSGTSIDEAGARTASDTEILVADITTLSLDDYVETVKKWLGTVTITLQNAGGSTQTTFAADFNYGHCKYTDMGDRDFTIVDFKANGRAGANDTGFNLRLLKHSAAGWTYAATGFVPGNGSICNFSTDYNPEKNLATGEHFHYDRTNLNTHVAGSGKEGFIVEVTSTANNAVDYMDTSTGVIYD